LSKEAITIRYQTAFIINPKAGGGRSLRVWQKLEPLLRMGRGKYRVHYTRYQGDGTNIAAKLRADGAELIVGVGGDGTLQEIVNGIDLKKNIFGIIPAGTGNGFRRSLKIPGNAVRALEGISKWEPRQVDLGMINGYYFLNVVGFGLDAAVAKQACVDSRILRGYPAYVGAFLTKLARFNSFSLTVQCDDAIMHEENTLLAVISNGCYYGGQLCVAPQARLDDGRLNLSIIRETKYLQTIALVVRAFFRKHLSHGAVNTAPATELGIRAAENIPVHIDGEIKGSLPAKIKVCPGVLTILAPPPVEAAVQTGVETQPAALINRY